MDDGIHWWEQYSGESALEEERAFKEVLKKYRDARKRLMAALPKGLVVQSTADEEAYWEFLARHAETPVIYQAVEDIQDALLEIVFAMLDYALPDVIAGVRGDGYLPRLPASYGRYVLLQQMDITRRPEALERVRGKLREVMSDLTVSKPKK